MLLKTDFTTDWGRSLRLSMARQPMSRHHLRQRNRRAARRSPVKKVEPTRVQWTEQTISQRFRERLMTSEVV